MSIWKVAMPFEHFKMKLKRSRASSKYCVGSLGALFC